MADVFQLEDIHPGGDEARALDSDDDAIEIDDVSTEIFYILATCLNFWGPTTIGNHWEPLQKQCKSKPKVKVFKTKFQRVETTHS